MQCMRQASRVQNVPSGGSLDAGGIVAYPQAGPPDSRLEGHPSSVGAGPPGRALCPLMLGGSRLVCQVEEGVL